jgi:hypothetical protein
MILSFKKTYGVGDFLIAISKIYACPKLIGTTKESIEASKLDVAC